MSFKGFAVSRVSFKVMALALMAMMAASPLSPQAQAGSGEPASVMLKKLKKSGGTTSARPSSSTRKSANPDDDHAAPASQNWSSASGGSGGKATTTTGIVTDGAATPFLLPDSATAMQAVISRYEGIAASGGWPSVPSGKFKKGATGKGVAALNQRLHVEGYLRKEATEGEFRETFTTATEDALRRFQGNMGLAVTGAVDGPTLKELNVPVSRRLSALRANVPRIAEYTKDLGSRYMVVNVPAMQIETVNEGRVYSRHNAIVGRPSRPTPVVMTPLTIVRFNPYWNAPHSIVEKDILPRMISSGASKVMNEMNMKIFKGVGGPEVEPNSVDWRRAVVDDYHFRQEPGGSNAMATAKIEFNSPFGIYLHDTPEPHLFGTGQRFYSSGCVRVEKVATLIDWILQGQDGIGQSRIAELAETKERLDSPVANAPQLRVAYLTAWPARDGVAAFRNDIYELDGTGFVVGQPLPLGETEGGQRYVLKPIPRSAQAVDEAEASGFASLFRSTRNTDKQDGTAVRSSSVDDDSLLKQKSKKTEKSKLAAKTTGTEKKKTAADDDEPTAKAKKPSGLLTNWGASKPEKPAKKKLATDTASKKKKLAKATAEDSKKKSSSKIVKASDTKKVAAKDVKADDKKKTAAKDVKVDDKKKVAAKAKAADSCKAGADGKLPAGCKPAAKKPAAKPETTAAATN